jgi:hypothetical protein
MHNGHRNKFETELAHPRWHASLVDYIFEAQMIGKEEEFPERLLRAIPPGRNLDLAYHKICVLVLNEARKKANNKLAELSIDKIIDLHTRILSSRNTGVVS